MEDGGARRLAYASVADLLRRRGRSVPKRQPAKATEAGPAPTTRSTARKGHVAKPQDRRGAVLGGTLMKSETPEEPGYHGSLAPSALIEIRRRHAAGSGESFYKLAEQEWLTTDGTTRRFSSRALKQAVDRVRLKTADAWTNEYIGVDDDQAEAGDE